MSLKDQINEDMKTFMREKNKTALDAVRMLRSEIKNVEINDRVDLDDAAVQKVVASAIKKRKDSAAQYSEANRPELAEKELAEVAVLEKYMPEQMGEEEVRGIIAEACKGVDTSDKSQFGRVMKEVMQKTAGKADGKVVNQLVREAFDGNN
ncbi:GatB/YqeY domain-containing protein [Limisalsivibrio acetivorans]|uniref:GatB/YqeY domain-containing protein n=1 Tax=Limisalsivibrio acetivorans TaxID=1304888 RepID=UPI0003B698A7|nr:GatB/YqeY domain-containing protein [Limisalsivibrio acetivorans]